MYIYVYEQMYCSFSLRSSRRSIAAFAHFYDYAGSSTHLAEGIMFLSRLLGRETILCGNRVDNRKPERESGVWNIRGGEARLNISGFSARARGNVIKYFFENFDRARRYFVRQARFRAPVYGSLCQFPRILFAELCRKREKVFHKATRPLYPRN